jgi:hypothetical protein
LRPQCIRAAKPGSAPTKKKKMPWNTAVMFQMPGSFRSGSTLRWDIPILYVSVNTFHNTLTHKYQTIDKCTRSGAYKLTCPDCKKVYVGQTGRSFEIRFYEHINAYKNNSHTSKYAKHLTELAHSPDSIQNTMQVLQYQSNTSTRERYHIDAEYINQNHLNDEHVFPNKILTPF